MRLIRRFLIALASIIAVLSAFALGIVTLNFFAGILPDWRSLAAMVVALALVIVWIEETEK